MFEDVFGSAIDKNFPINIFGTSTCLSPPDPEYNDILDDGFEDLDKDYSIKLILLKMNEDETLHKSKSFKFSSGIKRFKFVELWISIQGPQ